ncbi:hypothetical protein Cdeb_02496 [Caldibacillus debilis GB1]|uniref:Uncharacterized protein n=1 Tax=Caldibacillus debilis GB1 TaxID=1339248 RepID=A0A420VK50_9BACI|nr:hypothetical protein Cdeb_02496 [Caldibacillus debilis GB1]
MNLDGFGTLEKAGERRKGFRERKAGKALGKQLFVRKGKERFFKPYPGPLALPASPVATGSGNIRPPEFRRDRPGRRLPAGVSRKKRGEWKATESLSI